MRKNNKGFTLAELLIVVAIIGVLVAIAIPVFSGQLKKAKLATDQANVRSAKAAAAAEYMSDGESGSVSYLYDGGKIIKFNDSSASIAQKGYGKSDSYKDTGAVGGVPKDGYVEVTVDDSARSAEYQIQATWVSSAGISALATGNFVISGNLTTANLKNQVKDAGLDPSKVISFTAEINTKIDKGNGDLGYMFKDYPNLKSIDLSNATLVPGKGDGNLFTDTPKNVNEITLPQCSDTYNITGEWYYADGTSIYPSYSGADKSTTRIKADDVKNHGNKIYRNPPSAKKQRQSSKQ